MKRSPDLPNIEDATLRACLAPLLDAMLAGGDTAPPGYLPPDLDGPDLAVPDLAVSDLAVPGIDGPGFDVLHDPANSNDLTVVPDEPPPRPQHDPRPLTRAEWRAAADDDFGLFRTIDQFLSLSEAERDAAAREFPRQIVGTLARIAAIRRRLLAQYDTATTVTALLERALARAAADAETGDGPMRFP